MTNSMNRLLGDAPRPSVSTVPLPPFRWKTRIALPLAIVLVTVAFLMAAAWESWAPAVDVKGTPVVLAAMNTKEPESEGTPNAPQRSTGGASVQAAGWVEPLPYAVFATSLAEGVIEEILVLEGDRVKKGDAVATLVAADAEIALARARGELQRADAMLVAAKETLEALIAPEQSLRMAEAKLAAANAEIAGFESEVAAANAMYDELADELHRKVNLVASGAVSELEIARLRFRLRTQQAVVSALPARRAALEASRGEADAALQAARRGRELLIGERSAVAIAAAERAFAEAGMREAELRVGRTRIVAPIDGVVLERLVSPGMMVSPSPSSAEGGRVLSLYDPTRLQVRADVPNADIALVGVGQAVEIKVEALPNTTLTGEVLRITAQADIAKNTVQVKVRVIDPPLELRPEMLCRVRIHAGGAAASSTPEGGSARQRVFAPKALLDADHAVVATSLRDGIGRAERRTVRIGSEERGAWIEVLDGLRPGDVLLDPRTVTDASRVRVTIERTSQGEGS
ncbi:MAG: efflux RND transporter periplasmic adaptor subunit [Phycisphaerae bacterium]|jgi:HlyD family secretion protein|nr:efflux RND transporter periplasmic adaptor subunit [Phycisphaerae bacterium]